MAIKKSELYSSLWKSCDELRGGMDASQYKDYVLVLLFIKYISDKYAGVPYATIKVPKGASFKDMVALKGTGDIGDDINKKIIGPIEKANKLSGMPDFNNPEKLGSGKAMVDRLTNLIAIFENPALDFSKNRAEGDDILGDAYEYLMRHFATESGKSKGQFYTPAEVSRVMAKIIGVNANAVPSKQEIYDPTCGSGSLLLKIADEAESNVTIFGQEKEIGNAALARMNMILHNNPTAVIKREDTLAHPLFLDANGRLKTFDFVVANPPFSDKSWNNGVDAANDIFRRFKDYGIPPNKNGDYAFLLHIIRSLKSRGKGTVILPHGVLFRGNAEAQIRTNIIRRGYIKGIIGLPANLFYGTGIPACIIVLDKENAENRKGIFMIDASKGFAKDGNKNRLRDQDIHKIVDVFNKQLEVEKYSRMVPVTEIESHEYNLNIPRYIDSQEPEDIQDIEAHLLGGIPTADIDALHSYWEVYLTLRETLFTAGDRDHYTKLLIAHDAIKPAIFSHPEFTSYSKKVNAVFGQWENKVISKLKGITVGDKPKRLIHEISENLLQAFSDIKLINKYDVYQHLMVYWSETMQDDCYLIAADGWKAETYRIIETISKGKKKGQEIDKGWACDLIPKQLMIDRYFKEEQKTINDLESEIESLEAKLTELEEEQGGDEGVFSDMDKVNKANVTARLKELKNESDESADEEKAVLNEWLKLYDNHATLKKKLKDAETALDDNVYKKYPTLTAGEVKIIVVEDKWMAALEGDIKTEMDRISQRLTGRIKELAERYESTLPELTSEVEALEQKVQTHLKDMGFVWK
jgi:type I restriction enzyme M protein